MSGGSPSGWLLAVLGWPVSAQVPRHDGGRLHDGDGLGELHDGAGRLPTAGAVRRAQRAALVAAACWAVAAVAGRLV